MMSDNEELGKSQKRPHGDSIVSVAKKHKSDEKDEKSPKKRRSSGRRENAKFLAICLTCFKFSNSTIGECSAFSYEHMCEDPTTKNLNELDEAIKIIQDKKASLTEPRSSLLNFQASEEQTSEPEDSQSTPENTSKSESSQDPQEQISEPSDDS